jgi:glycosyltransferase 2 family protein
VIEIDSLPTPAKNKSRWYLLVSILLSAVFLYFAIRGISWSEFTQAVLSCRIEYLLPSMAISVINYWVRSQRWGILVQGKKPIAASTIFWACGAGYLGNNFLPFRSGEVIRSIALGQKAGISKVYVFATALTERILDAIFLILLALFLIPTVGTVPGWLPSAMRSLGILSIAAMIVLLLAPRMEKGILSLFHRILLPGHIRPGLIHLLEQFLQGAASFQNPGRAALFLLMTCLIWFLDGIGVMFSARAFSLNIQLNQGLLLLIGLGLGSAIPSVPGYVGVYQFVTVTILTIFGYPKGQVLAFILVVQAIGMLLVLVWGLIGFWRLGIHPNNMKKNNS